MPQRAPVSERRLVSILFADLVGFTPFAEERDPEEVRATLTRYFDLAREIVERYGGTVEKFIGDAVMAVWGAPVAREDDAERAVRAALELVDGVRTVAPAIVARAAVLTGEAAVTLGATGQGMVAGDLVNTAARLQSVAPPGTVLTGEATMLAASGAIAFEPAGDQALKGKSAGVPAWRALRIVAERGGRNRSEGLEAPFVGRDDELRLLRDSFHATGRDHRLRTISITGQAGIGKSRLAWEFEKILDGIVEDVYWHRGRSPSIAGGLTFWALGEMVRRRFGLAETDDEATTRAMVAAELPRWIADEEERRWVEPALLTLLGAAGEARIAHDQLFGAWRTFFERVAEHGTVVLVFEDLHWADDGLLAFLDHLAEWSRGAPILLVTLARPELLERRPDWGSGLRLFTSVPLEPLTPIAMRELLAGLVPGLPEPAVDAIVARADGIPLYAVETVRMLVAEHRLVPQDDGTFQPAGDLSELAVPATLRSLIAARLDALEPADRGLLQAASVLGQSFTASALQAVVADGSDLEPRLGSLVRRELLVRQRDPRSPELGQWAFVQALLREVAYGTLARADRRRLHLAAARHFEGVGGDHVAAALAAQYLAAWSASGAGEEADALAVQARLALRAAAERAAALGSLDQAVQLLRQALEVAPDDTERATILERAGDLATSAGRHEAAEELLVRAGELYAATGDRSAAARVVARRAQALSGSRRFEAGLALTSEAVERYADLGEDAGRVALLAQHARYLFFGQRIADCVAVADAALPMAEGLDLPEIVAELLVTRGTALTTVGRELEGIAVLEGGLKLATAHGLTATELRARINLSGVLGAYDARAAVEVAVTGAELALRLGLRAWVPTLAGNAATNAVDTGEWERALALLERASEAAVEKTAQQLLASYEVVLRAHRGEDVSGSASHLLGWLDARIAAGEESFTSSRHDLAASIDQAAGRWASAWDEAMASARLDAFNARQSYGWAILLAAHAADERRVRGALDGLRATGSHAPTAKLMASVAGSVLLALAGDTRGSLAGFRDCAARAPQLGCVLTQAEVGLIAGTLLDPSVPEVRALVEDARAIFVRVGARPSIERADAILADTGPVARRADAFPSERRAPADRDVRPVPGA
jgi:class 3 adenylate cyclase/tetratricopeptide (TPR) repeat protein